MAKGAAKAQPQRLTCPACGTVASYPPGAPASCRVCGTVIPDPEAPAFAPAPSAPAPMAYRSDQPRGEPPTALAIIALISGILSLVTLWVLPVCIVLAAVAIICGIVVLSRHEDDSGAQAMAGIGIGLAVLGLLLMWWAFAFIDQSSGSSVYVSSSDTTDDGGSSSNSGGGSSGDGGSSGGGGGGSGDGGGSPDSGGSSGDTGGDSGGSGGGASTDTEAGLDTGVDTDSNASPAPVAMMVGLGLLGAAAWRRRA